MARRKRTYDKPKVETRPSSKEEVPAEDLEEKVEEEAEKVEEAPDPDPEPEKEEEPAPAKLPAPRCSHCGENRWYKGRRGDKMLCSNCRQLVLIV
jgi:formylmethanofuran dehydrogenase subunit E